MLKLSLLILFAVLGAEPAGLALQTAQPRTVLDYYRLLPDKYFEAGREEHLKWVLDPNRGSIVDVRNGYLYAPGDGAQITLYVCLFKKPDASYVVAVKSDVEGSNYLDFYRYHDGRLVEVRKSPLPVAVDENLDYEMPRYGTTIKVKDKRGRLLYSLAWQGERFVKKG